MGVFASSCLATKVFIGTLLATGSGWVIINRPMVNGGQLPTKQLHDINWGSLDHASRAPQLMSCTFVITVCVCVCVCVCVHMYVRACMYICW